MESLNNPEAVREIEKLIAGLNNAWLENRIDDLNIYFHEDVIALPPGSDKRIAGREAMVDSYRQFVNAAKVNSFEILDLKINVYNSTAVADLTFKINYEIHEKVYSEKGTDILIFNHNGDEWKIIWRTQISS